MSASAGCERVQVRCTKPGRGRRRMRNRVVGVLVILSLAAALCGARRESPARPGRGPAACGEPVTVASFDFPESELLADLYGVALRSERYDVRFARRLGPRELVDPALARGLVELVPEYAGTALQFLSLGRAKPTPDVAATHEALERTLRDSELMALDPAPAQDSNAIVVTPRPPGSTGSARSATSRTSATPHLRRTARVPDPAVVPPGSPPDVRAAVQELPPARRRRPADPPGARAVPGRRRADVQHRARARRTPALVALIDDRAPAGRERHAARAPRGGAALRPELRGSS